MAAIITIKKKTSVSTELARMHERIMNRAFSIFDNSGHGVGTEVDDWLTAERELVWRPPVVLTERDNEFCLRIAAPGVNPGDVDIEVTPECLLVKTERPNEESEHKGRVHTSEFKSGNMFRLIHFPKAINPDAVTVEFDNGVLEVNAAIAA